MSAVGEGSTDWYRSRAASSTDSASCRSTLSAREGFSGGAVVVVVDAAAGSEPASVDAGEVAGGVERGDADGWSTKSSPLSGAMGGPMTGLAFPLGGQPGNSRSQVTAFPATHRP